MNDTVKAIMEAAKFPSRAINVPLRFKDWFPKDTQNHNVKTALLAFLEDPSKFDKVGFFISGRMSSGKTVLLGRIALGLSNFYAKDLERKIEGGDDPVAPFYYIQAHKLSQILNNEWEGINRQAFDDLIHVDVLFIDDVDKIVKLFLTNKGEGMLEMLLKERSDYSGKTIMTSSIPPSEMECSEYLGRFLNRFKQLEIYGSYLSEEEV